MPAPTFSMANTFDWCLKFFILLSPIIWMPGIAQKHAQLLFFTYGAILLFGLSMFLPAKRESRNCSPFALLLISSAVCLVRFPSALNLSFLNIVFGVLLYYAIVRAAGDIAGILKWFAFVFLINMAIMTLQLHGIDFLYKPELYKGPLAICGLMAQKNHLAMFVSFVSPILVLVSWIFLPLVALVLYVLDCHCATAGFITILAILIFFNRRHKRKVITLSLLAVFCTWSFFRNYFQEYHFTTRFPAWKFMARESFINPFIGRGLGSFARDIKSLPYKVTGSYNEYFRFTYELGIVPVIVILWSVFRCFRRIFARTDISILLLASMASFLGMMALQDPLHIPRLAVPFLTIVALFEAHLIDQKGLGVKLEGG